MTLIDNDIEAFITRHRLPATFRQLVQEHYDPIVTWLSSRRTAGETLLLGINGAQGTGKSTLAEYLQLALESGKSWRVAVLSIDDFYLTKAERQALAKSLHPLLETRGVPGTHDIAMLKATLDALRSLGPGDAYHLPRFDKASDDRALAADWPTVSGPVDVVILEGWCIGSVAEADIELGNPVNDLERRRDPDGAWRRYINTRLASDYAELFGELHALIFLKAPGFDAIYRWRLEQEQKLAASRPADTSGIMDEIQIAEFIQHYERITRNNLEVIGNSADVVLELDEYHHCIASHYTS